MNPNLRKLALALAAAAVFSGPALAAAASNPITEADVLAAESRWGDGIVSIGNQFSNGGDYKAAAAAHIAKLYAYGDSKVLFKPTKAAEDQFRETPEEALSYFVGGGEKEDHGFAIQPWTKVRFENDGIVIGKDTATAMGNYYFTDAKTGKDVKVEFTMAFIRAGDGHLELFTHHSSFPYVPQH
jgi:hypothetical protein